MLAAVSSGIENIEKIYKLSAVQSFRALFVKLDLTFLSGRMKLIISIAAQPIKFKLRRNFNKIVAIVIKCQGTAKTRHFGLCINLKACMFLPLFRIIKCLVILLKFNQEKLNTSDHSC